MRRWLLSTSVSLAVLLSSSFFLLPSISSFSPPHPPLPPSQPVEMQMSVWIIRIGTIRIQRLRLRLRQLRLLCFLLLTGLAAVAVAGVCVRLVMKVCLSHCWNTVFFFFPRRLVWVLGACLRAGGVSCSLDQVGWGGGLSCRGGPAPSLLSF